MGVKKTDQNAISEITQTPRRNQDLQGDNKYLKVIHTP